MHATSGGSHYVRVGSTKQIVLGPRLPRSYQNRDRTLVFDGLPVLTSSLEYLDQRKLKLYFDNTTRVIPWSNLLHNTSILKSTQDGTSHATVAGLLMFGTCPQNHLQSTSIEAAVYQGLHPTSDDLIHSKSITGTADSQIDEAINFVDQFMLKPARKPLGQRDYTQFDLNAVREAIVNAVAHRDYSIAGSKVRIFLYSDRIEISSPGTLPNTLTVESMAFRVFTRNQLLVQFLSRNRSSLTGEVFLESRGEGVQNILRLSEIHSGRIPQYDVHGDELLLTIWAFPSPHLSRSDEE